MNYQDAIIFPVLCLSLFALVLCALRVSLLLIKLIQQLALELVGLAYDVVMLTIRGPKYLEDAKFNQLTGAKPQ